MLYFNHYTIAGITSPLPATLNSLADWASALGNRDLQYTTIKSYLVGLRSAHADMGYDDGGSYHPVPKLVVDGTHRMRGEADIRQSITRDILFQLLPRSGQNELLGATLHASYHLAFAGFLRFGEFR